MLQATLPAFFRSCVAQAQDTAITKRTFCLSLVSCIYKHTSLRLVRKINLVN